MPLIYSLQNPIVRRLKELSTLKGRNESEMILLEGTHLLQEILQIGKIPIELIATEKWFKSNSDLLKIVSSNVQLTKVSFEVLEKSLTTKTPDGVACLLPFKELPIPKIKANYILALDRLQDPGNLGTIFRNALAAEIEIMWLALGADPLGQKSLRASSGAIFQLPYERFGSSEVNAIKELEAKLQVAAQSGFQVLGSFCQTASVPFDLIPYWEIDWMRPTVLVLGNEGNGIHPIIQDCCTCGVTLPHSKAVESLNVASASVPLLLERKRTKMISCTN